MGAPFRVAVLLDTASSYGRGLVRGVARYARLRGPWSFFIAPEAPGRALDRLRGWRAQGVIARVRSRAQRDAIAELRVPALDLDQAVPGGFPQGARVDEAAVGRLAAEHLTACGLRQLAFCGWAPGGGAPDHWLSARRRGFLEAARAAGVPVRAYDRPARYAGWSWRAELRALAAWLRTLPRPCGLLACHDQRARHVLEAARLAGLAVPRDVAVLGVDNDEVLCEMASPPLSSVELDAVRVGFEAAAALDRLRRGRRPGRPAEVPPAGLVARASTDTLATDDEVVVAAVRYLRAHACRPIRVADLLEAVPVSRRTLEVRFRRALGRTPHDELGRLRLQKARELLLQTHWPLKKVAEASGFAYAEHFHAFFRRAMKTTPDAYRKAHRG
jgi:LacI family transcriptional regulator